MADKEDNMHVDFIRDPKNSAKLRSRDDDGPVKKAVMRGISAVVEPPARAVLGTALATGSAADQLAYNNSKTYRDSGLAATTSKKGTGYQAAKSHLRWAAGLDDTEEDKARDAARKSTPQAGYKKGGSVAPRGWGKARVKRK